jgi:hypothetical protein
MSCGSLASMFISSLGSDKALTQEWEYGRPANRKTPSGPIFTGLEWKQVHQFKSCPLHNSLIFLTNFELLIRLPFQQWEHGRPADGGHHYRRGLKSRGRLTILNPVRYITHKHFLPLPSFSSLSHFRGGSIDGQPMVDAIIEGLKAEDRLTILNP